jgi:hypothetical protein
MDMTFASENGIEHLDSVPRVDPQRGMFITSKGDEIELSGKPITSLMLERVTAQGRPKIPHKEVLMLGKYKEMQAVAQDPDYLALLAEWQADTNIRTMRYIFNVGVKGEPPQDFIDEQMQFFPDATSTDLKYLWVASRVPDEDIDRFSEAILGRTIATEAGLQEAADSFPGTDQRDSAE